MTTSPKTYSLSRGILFLLLPFHLFAQPADEYLQSFIEIITENGNGSEEFDYTELGEQIADWNRSPIDINSPESSVLVQWKIISEIQYRNLQHHIQRHGSLLDILELQSVPGFSIEQIRILQTITKVSGRELQTQAVKFGDLLVKGNNELFLRWGKTIQPSSGYSGLVSPYEGSPEKLYFRYRHRNGNTLSYGITGEKDAGEAFLNGSNPQGFDFYSLHLSLQGYKSWLPTVIIGDFNANFGQGLIMHSGFGAGKSSLVTNTKRSGLPLRAYTSVEENNFLRGIGITIKPVKNFSLTLLASTHNRDGNLQTYTIYDNTGFPIIANKVTSLQTSGLHRTGAEIADEDVVRLTQEGICLQYQQGKVYVAFNALHSKLNTELIRATELYNRYYFNGHTVNNLSIDYGTWIGGVHFFGETAMSGNGGISTLNGILAGIDRHVTAALVYRSYGKEYQALTPNAFGESALANNENGLYTGIEITPDPKWKLQFYHDIWSHPWLRSNADSPSGGVEYFGRISYTRKRKLEIYAQYQNKEGGINWRRDDESIAQVVSQYRSHLRFHINNMLAKGMQLRTRLEWTYYANAGEKQKGFLIYQDCVYSPIASPWTLSARVTLFDSDDYDSRAYTYENDLINYYSIPSFSGRGTRWYLNVRFKGIRNLTAELKYGQTRYLNQTTIGSNHDEIQGNVRSEIRLQFIYRFES